MASSDDKKDSDGGKGSSDDIIAFPQSRVRPPGAVEPYMDLGTTATMAVLDLPEEPTTGHWCSQCKGIWFGYLLEVECPVCGNRDG